MVEKQHNANQPIDASHLWQQGDYSFMNHHSEEHYHTNHDAIAHNTRSKRRAIEDVIPPLIQASSLDASPHVPMMNVQSRCYSSKKTRYEEPKVYLTLDFSNSTTYPYSS